MKNIPSPAIIFIAAAATLLSTFSVHAEKQSLFDGKTLTGWETTEPDWWRVEDGALTAGDEKKKIPRNSFLFTKQSYKNFEFRCEFKLTGDPKTGLINSGIQFRSKKIANGHASGYQADIGDPTWWGCIYDEHRRNKVIAKSDMAKINPVLKRNDWNEYVIRCEGPRSRLWINGVQTVDFVEKGKNIAAEGHIAVQVHSGGAAKVAFRNLTIEEFETLESPLRPDEQRATFTVPEGYTVELVASEETGLPKPIKVRFDDQGRMWSMTATEYPVDANETPDLAKSLWAKGGKDRVVVFDAPLKPGPHQARVFADQLAMPMAVLPYKDGALVGHGPEILFLRDTNGDGKADKREVLVNGFGVQDSHLMPHQFTFGPGGWIYMAQGAFNRSMVRAGDNPPVKFDYCKLGRFKPDGSKFEAVGYGLNNIWGLDLGREGEFFVQEANDMKYSVTAFQVGTSYPGIGNDRFKPYAPFVGPAANFLMGGTGLSGLALSDDLSGSYPDPWHHVMFVANPITRTINAVKVTTDEQGRYAMERLPDFVTSTDEWFRPIAITIGPDGCLYIVDWYNKIISHNEVPRKHPARDKSRGRIWRVRHDSQANRTVPNIADASNKALLNHLNSDSSWAIKAAWQQIVQRDARELAPALTQIIRDEKQRVDTRIHALWALDGLGLVTTELANSLCKSPSRNLRREAAAVRSCAITVSLVDDADGQVRAQALRSLSRNPVANIGEILQYARPEQVEVAAGDAPWGGRHGKTTPPGPQYDRVFERYLVRRALEKCPNELAAFLASPAASTIPGENRLYATLALPQAIAPEYFVRAWSGVDRDPTDEELLTLLKGFNKPSIRPLVIDLFTNEKNASGLISATLRLQDRLGNVNLKELLAAAAQKMVGNPANDDQLIELATAFRMKSLKDNVWDILRRPKQEESRVIAAINALGRMDAGVELAKMSSDSSRSVEVRRAALAAAATSNDTSMHPQLLKGIAALPDAQRTTLLGDLARSKNGSVLVLAGVSGGQISKDELQAEDLVHMRALVRNNATMDELWKDVADRFPSAVRFNGGADDYVASTIDLPLNFTVETWVRLDAKIDNKDGILGRPGSADCNFYGSIFRLYAGPKVGDLVTAKQPITPRAWTHLAVTRDSQGVTRIYINGEFNAKGSKVYKLPFENLQIGRTTPADGGTSGELLEFRVWHATRNPEQIRANFSRSFAATTTLPEDLAYYYHPALPDVLNGKAELRALTDAPKLMDEKTANEVAAKISKYKSLAIVEGDLNAGQALFTGLCMSCHTLDGKGAAAAPPLDGSGHRDLDNLLHALVTPSAAVEPGYRAFRVETKAGQLVEGFLVKQDSNGVTIRFMGGTNVFFPVKEIRAAAFTERSFMLEGLLDNLPDAQVTDLFTYLRSLKEGN